MEYPSSIVLKEVCPRDGFQMEKEFIPTDRKIEIIDLLSECGFREIQITAFMSPKAIPNHADADEVCARINRAAGVRYIGLAANQRGVERAMAAGVDGVEFSLSASDAHGLANVNATTRQSLDRLRACLEAYPEFRIFPGLAVAFGCPYEGAIPEERLRWIVGELVGYGASDITIADTVGVANPRQVYDTITELLHLYPGLAVTLHLHDPRGIASANILAGLLAGAKGIDASAAGLGGCPFAPGATGNVATEDVLHMLDLMGVETGVDLDPLLRAAARIRDTVGHADSRLLKAGPVKNLPAWAAKNKITVT